MAEKYRDEILSFLNCCLDTMFSFDKNVIVIEQDNPRCGKVYKSLEIYKDSPNNSYITYQTDLSDESYKILYNNIADWRMLIYPIKVVRKNNSYIRIWFDYKNFNEDAIKMAIAQLKQNVEKENPLTFDEDLIGDIDRTDLKVPEQKKKEKGEMRRTMRRTMRTDYTTDTAERIINDFVNPCLGNMTNNDWEPNVIILPKKRNGLGYIFNDIDSALKHSIDEPCISTYVHNITSDTDYQILFDNMGPWTRDIPEIKVCYLKDGNLRIRFDDSVTPLSDRAQAVQNLKQTIRQNVNVGVVDERLPLVNEEYKEKKGEKKRMNDFSLTNLKDALVNKITHLDKKTVTILALIALVLLVVGKYQDIKDILIGIKDKVKRSKNFKAMVADGTAAMDSLKKIVGVKDSKKDTTDEA
nr:MAG TPA: hypothetical protein [Caudoviricetes sp.]